MKGKGEILGEVFGIDTVQELEEEIALLVYANQTLDIVAKIRKAMEIYAKQQSGISR